MDTGEVFTRVWAAFDAGEHVVVCAWCRRVQLDGDWFRLPHAAEQAIDARLVFSHGICGECADINMAPPRPSTGRDQPAL